MTQFEPLFTNSGGSYSLILQRFADQLELEHKGKIDCKIRTQTLEGVVFWIFTIQPEGRPNSVFELLQVRAPIGSSHAAIETFHLEGDLQLCKIGSDNEFNEIVARILSHSRTTEIIQTIASESVEERLQQRSLLIAEQPFTIDNEKITQVSILGVSGFLSIDTLHKLAREPNNIESAYQEWNGSFVATLRFEGAVKIMLTQDEMVTLQQVARKTLKNAKDES